jgi:hypothetical protein
LRFLIDESADMNIGRALAAAGHDVKSIAADSPSTVDEDVLRLARDELRIVITEDGDFGRIVFLFGQASVGVIFVRYPRAARLRCPADVVDLVVRYGDRLEGAFVVIQPGRIRIGRNIEQA